MPQPPHCDAELEEACRLLGIKIFDPPLPPPREPRVVDGHACLVGCGPRESCSQF